MSASQESLLFGLFAWRLGYITQEQLSAALRERLETDGSLPELLVVREYISASTQALLQQLIDQQVKRGETSVDTCLTKMGLPTDALESMALTARGDDAPLDTVATQPFGGSGTRRGDPTAATPGTAPQRIGPYRLLHQIGSGGMGTVWLAEQQEPVRRKVALKLIRSGHADEQVIARFEAERQALAMMDHEHIARVYDAGTSDDGTPYFVMELVDGDPITEFCDQMKMALPERLELFQQACEAVQHAHHKGIIHRDLKPSNILVHAEQGKAKVKVIDFGLAKALQQESRLTDKTLQTEVGQVIGTISYMSPEQASLDVVDIDTRTDIYSLGVILYELLSGSTPIDRDTLKRNAVLKVLEMIRDKEPPKPSDRLSSSKHVLSSISEQRQIQPSQLQRILRGDVDWIVMKAIEKDRDRRYGTPRDLSDDIGRYLNGAEVKARPPSASYRLRKFVRRNLGIVVGASFLIVVVSAGVAATVAFAIEAQRARNDAEASAARSDEVLSIVTDSFQAADPHQGANASTSAKDVLIRARNRITNSKLDRKGKIALLRNLGASFLGLGDYESAISAGVEEVKLRDAEFGDVHVDTVQALNNLGGAYYTGGRFDEALSAFERAEKMGDQLLSKDDATYLRSLDHIALVYRELGHVEESLAGLENVLELRRRYLGETHEDTLTSMSNVAHAYAQAGRRQEAINLLKVALENRRKSFGENHPSTLSVLNNLAIAYETGPRSKEAIRLYEDAIERLEAKLGVSHLDTLQTKSNLARAHLKRGEFEDAQRLLEEALPVMRSNLGAEHPVTLIATSSLALAYHRLNRPGDAEQRYQAALKVMRERLGEEHPDTLETMNNFAAFYRSFNRYEEAIELQEAVLAGVRHTFGPDHPQLVVVLRNLAGSYLLSKQENAAIPLYEELIDLRAAQSGEDHPDVILFMKHLARAHTELKQFRKAADVYAEILRIRSGSLGESHENTLASMDRLGEALIDSEQFEEAAEVLADCLFLREKQHPKSWMTFSTQATHGLALLRLGRSVDGKNALEVAYRGLLADQESIPEGYRKSYMEDAIKPLIEIAELNEDTEAVSRWKRALQELEDQD